MSNDQERPTLEFLAEVLTHEGVPPLSLEDALKITKDYGITLDEFSHRLDMARLDRITGVTLRYEYVDGKDPQPISEP